MTTTGTRTTCKAIAKSGRPCQSFAVTGSDFCVMHAPERAADMADARRKGGHARHGRQIGSVGVVQPVKLATLADVLGVIEGAVNDVLTLENSIGRARAIGYLAGAWGTLYESSELERRVAALEALNEQN